MMSNWIPSEFNIFGCEYSTDIDIGLLVPNQKIIEDYKNKKIKLDLSLIKTDLESLGFDLNNISIDINLIYIDPNTKNLSTCLIGSKDTQNIIYHTYHLHPQAYPIFFTNPVQIDLIDKVRFFSKLILDSIDLLLGKIRYTELRPKKTQVYTDLPNRLDFSLQILNETNFENLFITNKDLTKSIGMKLSQLVLLFNEKQAYTKKTISNQISLILPIDYDSILYILSRGKLGKLLDQNEISKIYKILLDVYKLIINEIKQNLNLSSYDLNLLNIIIADFDLAEFIKSPEKPTTQLAVWIDNLYSQTNSLNKIFELKSYGYDELPQLLKNNIHIEDQRSLEWLELLKFYKCGNTINNRINYIDCTTNFNLIRGCLGEKLLINYIDWNKLVGFNVTKCMCGLLVETKGLKDSIGIAPDLLLIGIDSKSISNPYEKIIIPVEIKTIVSDPEIINRNFLREVQLGTKQLDTSISLINKITKTTTYGLLVICFIHDNKIIIKYKKYL